MKVYTRTGDKGTTSLVGGERVSKTDARVDAYGTVDELMAFTALLTDRLRTDGDRQDRVEELNRIQCLLMTAAAVLASDPGAREKVPSLDEATVSWLEGRIDALQAGLPPLAHFTIPGGHPAVSLCHVCRTVCRRAERAALRADALYGADARVLAFLNRLSDYFYVLGRSLTAYYQVQEVLWVP